MSARASAAGRTHDYSNRSGGSLAVLGGALGAAVLLVVADLTTLLKAGPIALSGHSQHDWAVFLLGLGAAVLGLWAGALRSRLALLGLVVIGVAVLVISLASDAPNIGTTGVVNSRLDTATTAAGPGFYLETAGAVVAIATGALGMIFDVGAPVPGRRRHDETD